MSRILSVAPVLAPHRYEQADLTTVFADLVGLAPERRDVLDRLHRSCSVSTRYLALPLEDYKGLDGFGDANDAFIEAALELGERAVRDALELAGTTPQDVDLILMTSVTGIAVLLSVELCSLTIQRDDDSMANLVGSGLFGDGAAAVVMAGDHVALPAPLDRTAPHVVTTRSRFFADTERVMGWDVGGSGFRIVLSPGVADVVRDHVPEEVDDFLATRMLSRSDVRRWVTHPGGPKVLEAMEQALDLPDDALAASWQSLDQVGNLSSSSVLHVLADTLRQTARTPETVDTHGVLMAMGPGFCVELVLLRWPGQRPA